MILKSQVRSLLIIIVCGACMAFTFEGEFIVGYLSVVCALTVISTIGYDEFDHGYSFLFTLPASRKTYVREKYLLTFLVVAAADLIGMVLVFLMNTVIRHVPFNFAETAQGILVMMGVALMMAAISIPLRIKYGSEKSRTVQYIIYALVLAGVLGAKSLAEFLHIDFSGISALSTNTVVPIVLMMFVVLYLLSEKICEGIIEKKEY
jgi:hypothetical protein